MTEGKRQAVRAMFHRIAPRYDLANTVMTAGRDARWRRRAVEILAPASGERVLDVGCGTGKMTQLVLEKVPCTVVGVDPAPGMLHAMSRRFPGVPLTLAEGERLPFRDATFDAVMNAFVLRNLDNLDLFFAEMRRILKPGGRLVSLEIAKPSGAIYGPFHGLYFGRIVPVLGGLVSGDREAYRYLARSVEGFPKPAELMERMGAAGFHAKAEALQNGAIVAYRAVCPARTSR